MCLSFADEIWNAAFSFSQKNGVHIFPLCRSATNFPNFWHPGSLLFFQEWGSQFLHVNFRPSFTGILKKVGFPKPMEIGISLFCVEKSRSHWGDDGCRPIQLVDHKKIELHRNRAARFFLGPEKVHQMTTNCTKRPYIIPIGHNLYQTSVKYTGIFQSEALQNLPKYWSLVLCKTNHLATLHRNRNAIIVVE
jgi:hypothetical protein